MDSPKAQTNKKWTASPEYRNAYEAIFNGDEFKWEAHIREVTNNVSSRFHSLSPAKLEQIKSISPCAYKLIFDSYELVEVIKGANYFDPR